MRNIVLLVALNALNAADAALTVALLRLGLIYEGNPLVLLMGWPTKIVGVAAISIVVWRLKPGWLSVPVMVYSGVVFYTVAFFALSV